MTLSALLESDARVACVVQGGGMRGTYSIAALAELERLGYTNRFAAVYGSSAGALNGAYFLAGQAREGVRIYVDHLSNKRFIHFARRPVIDIDYLIDDVLTHRVPLRQAAVLASATDLIVKVTNARTGAAERFVAQDQRVPLMELLRATAALPLVFGKEVTLGDERYVDGGFVDQVPLMDAVADGFTHIVVILTRSRQYRAPDASPLTQWVLRRAASWCGHSPAVIGLLGRNCGAFNHLMDGLDQRPRADGANVWVVAPAEGVRMASRLTSDRAVLERTAELATSDVRRT